MKCYYNEHNANKAAWLRELIKQGLIAPGEVDERDIREVESGELRPFNQCHLFAGIGVWSFALAQAGWPDDAQVWTGSCPCQPFSTAGKQRRFEDERHLWPEMHRLIRECRPSTVFGEQVARGNEAWVRVAGEEMQAEGYRFAAVDAEARFFGQDHQRRRFYWVADTNDTGKPVRPINEEAHWMPHSSGYLQRRSLQQPDRGISMAYGSSFGMDICRGYGDGLVTQQAIAFVKAYLSVDNGEGETEVEQ